jgi:hypothetical protein
MLYLFNAAGSGTQPEIFIREDGKPVAVTHIAQSFDGVKDTKGQDIPASRQYVGSVCSTGDHQMTNGNELTLVGIGYCNIMGVEKNPDALGRFVTNCSRNQLPLEYRHG